MNELALRYRLRIKWHLILALFWICDEKRCGEHLAVATQELEWGTNEKLREGGR